MTCLYWLCFSIMTNNGDKAKDRKINWWLPDHSLWKPLRTESTENGLNVDGDLGYTIQWLSLETDVVCPVIALSLPLWSRSPLGVTSRLKGWERGDIHGPITARLVKPPSAGHSSISTLSLSSWGEKHWAGANSKLQGYKHTQREKESKRERKTLTCSFPSKASMPKLWL